MGTLHECLCAFMMISRWILLIMTIFSDKSCTGKQNAYFIFNYFSPENLAVFELMWKNMVQPDRPQLKIRGLEL